MHELTLEEIRKVQLLLLQTLKEICDKNQLKLYLCGGTLLGAIRHKGYIPWDDDIDVCLPRPHYERLIQLANAGFLPKHVKLLSYETGNLKRPFIKLIDDRTILEPKTQMLADGNSPSVFIDVLPVDGLPEKYKKAQRVYDRVKNQRKMLLISSAKLGRGGTMVSMLGKIVLHPFMKVLGGPDFWNRRIIKLARKVPYENSAYVGIITYGLYGIHERMEKEAFEQDVDVEFEKHSYKAMSCWHEYLSNLYGEYTILPPEEKRVLPHSFTAYLRDEYSFNDVEKERERKAKTELKWN